MNKKDEPLVSIITPCYNGEKTVARLMQSVLDQTYDNIEFIIVNDGSTDRSGDIIDSYEQKFNDRGFIFIHHRQENKGVSCAINAGLQLFSGDYLCWPDADDYLEPTSVEKRVRFLIDHPEYGIVTSNAYVRKADDLEHYKLLTSKANKNNLQEDQFKLLINGDSIFCPGCHMARTSAFLDVNPERCIYPARRGQNWQLLLPIYYKYNRAYLDEPLYNYIDYPNSMSKDADTFESKTFRRNEHETIITETLKMIEKVQQVDLQEEITNVRKMYSTLRMETAVNYEEKEAFQKEYDYKKKNFGLYKRDQILKIRNASKVLNRWYERARKIRHR